MFRFKVIFQVALFRHTYTSFTCSAHDIELFSTKQHFFVHCSRNTPFLPLSLLQFTFVSVLFSNMWLLHKEHTASVIIKAVFVIVITVSQRSTSLCHMYFNVTSNLLCHRHFIVSQALYCVSGTLLCHRHFIVSQALYCVTGTLLCIRHFIVSQAVYCVSHFIVSQALYCVSGTLLYHRHFIVSQALYCVSGNLVCHKNLTSHR
jgi:hypothetical protein